MWGCTAAAAAARTRMAAAHPFWFGGVGARGPDTHEDDGSRRRGVPTAAVAAAMRQDGRWSSSSSSSRFSSNSILPSLAASVARCEEAPSLAAPPPRPSIQKLQRKVGDKLVISHQSTKSEE